VVSGPRYRLEQVNLEGEASRFRWLRAPATAEIALTGITAKLLPGDETPAEARKTAPRIGSPVSPRAAPDPRKHRRTRPPSGQTRKADLKQHYWVPTLRSNPEGEATVEHVNCSLYRTMRDQRLQLVLNVRPARGGRRITKQKDSIRRAANLGERAQRPGDWPSVPSIRAAVNVSRPASRRRAYAIATGRRRAPRQAPGGWRDRASARPGAHGPGWP